MLISEILKYCDEVQNNKEVRSRCSSIFLAPYYLYIEERIKSLSLEVNLLLYDNMTPDLAYQIAKYAYGQYFMYIYPYEYQLALNNGLFEKTHLNTELDPFVSQISHEKNWIIYLFDKYPKLLVLLDSFTDSIISYIREVLVHYVTDSTDLNETWALSQTKLVHLGLFEGDIHNGRCVVSITFETGAKIYYKPRNASNEFFFESVLKFLNDIGLLVKIGIPKYINKQGYSWHIKVSEQDFSKLNDLPQYYKNWGMLQCLFYLLGTQDIIPDNILCVNDIPYLIDCESLLLRPYVYADGTEMTLYLQKSVLKTGILPDWMFDDANQRTSISSTLFAFRGKCNHLPHITNQALPISRKYLQNFLNGFDYAYKFVQVNSDVILKFLVNSDINQLESRVLLHPTMIYSCLMQESVTPEYLNGKKSIFPLINTLVQQDVYGDNTNSIVLSIKNQLEYGNIPYFVVNGENKALKTKNGDIICAQYYKHFCTNLQWVTSKIKSFSDKDLLYQDNIIKETLCFFLDVEEKKHSLIKLSSEDMVEYTPSDYIAAAETIGEIVNRRKIIMTNQIGFLGRTRNLYDGVFQISLLNNSIYDGLAGICLFYRALYECIHNKTYYEDAKLIFQQICKDVINARISSQECQTIPISPLTGITGALYLMESYPEDFYSETFYSLIVAKIKDIVPKTEHYDYMSGIAGLICFICQAKLITKADKDQLLDLCGKRLIELGAISDGMMSWAYLDGAKNAVRHRMILGGYAHGSSSIAVALYRLYQYSYEPKYLEAFKKTLKHDRSLYSDEISGWIDNREPLSKQDSGSWCHGAAGVALSRLQLLDLGYGDDLIEKELKVALPHIEKRLGYNLSVCHGMLGNLEIQKAIYSYFNINKYNSNSWEYAIINEISHNRELLCGDDNYDSLVGLFMGVSGIGYQLLRFTHWSKCPSIMCLEVQPHISSLHI